MKRVFISQGMINKSDDDILKIRKEIVKKVKEIFKDEEIEIIDSFIKEAPNNAKPLWYLGKSLEFLSTADVAVFPDGFEDFRGCKLEYACCIQYGIKVIHLENTLFNRGL